MSSEDRDKKFEQALKLHLQAEAFAAAHAWAASDANREGVAPGDASRLVAECPDAEILAAFHERMLTDPEMNATKEHVAGCAQCQEVLALLEVSDEVVSQDAKQGVNERESVSSTSGLSGDDAATREEQVVPMAVPGAGHEPREIPSRRDRSWRWKVPSLALAAGLLVWVVSQHSTFYSSRPSGNLQVAQESARDELTARNAAPAQTPTTSAPDSANSMANPAERSMQTSPLPAENKKDSGAGLVGGAVSSLPMNGRNVNTMIALDKSQAEEQKRERDGAAFGVAASGTNAGNLAGKPRVGDSATVAAPAPAVLQPPPPAVNGMTGAATAEVNKEKSTDAKAAARMTMADRVVADKMASAANQPTSQPKTKAAAEAAPSTASLKAAKLNVPARVIVTPDGTVAWRLGGGAKLERSTDSGVTWTPQNSGASRELLAGAAPSALVCWLVGRGGTILRTTDGGGHWSAMSSPIPGDLARVSAADAAHATVSAADAAGSFATADGGATWTPIKN